MNTLLSICYYLRASTQSSVKLLSIDKEIPPAFRIYFFKFFVLLTSEFVEWTTKWQFEKISAPHFLFC